MPVKIFHNDFIGILFNFIPYLLKIVKNRLVYPLGRYPWGHPILLLPNDWWEEMGRAESWRSG